MGYAQTATLSSTDYFGNTIASSTADYTPGEDYMVTLDLGINTWALKEIKLSTGTYGVNNCTFMMNKCGKGGDKWEPVGMFEDMCQWPNFVDTAFYLNVENIPQFKNGYELGIMCNSQDVAFKTAKKNLPCAGGLALTPQNNQLANPYTNFDFEPLYESPATWRWDTGLIYFSNFADIFLKGLNPVLDLLWVGINEAVYQESFERILMAYGYMTHGQMTMKGKKQQTAINQEDIAWMVHDFEQFGFWTYGMETLAAAYPIFEYFQDNDWAAFNDYIFEFAEYSETQFGNVVNGGLTYKDEWWTDLNWYFRLNVLAQETMTTIYMAMYEPGTIVQWWPRHARAIWNFFLAFYE
eukprot:TRINITY_DN3528_c0_g1_i4.p1 TRINITY_DN3528_c0_g1~~TRINITY_DN3528_c0_g1_i4.p1  ORF type:complete len:363 (+),score=34.86 TRINITY_DN3528_c0_g1_i4:35-1090(+)